MYLHSFENFGVSSNRHCYADVWPLCVQFNEEFDNTFTMLLQLACVLQMKGGWTTSWTIRIFVVTENECEPLNNLHVHTCM